MMAYMRNKTLHPLTSRLPFLCCHVMSRVACLREHSFRTIYTALEKSMMFAWQCASMLVENASLHRHAGQLLLNGIAFQFGVTSTSHVLMCHPSTRRRHDSDPRQWCVSDEQVKLNKVILCDLGSCNTIHDFIKLSWCLGSRG